jgi:hypothetical protein
MFANLVIASQLFAFWRHRQILLKQVGDFTPPVRSSALAMIMSPRLSFCAGVRKVVKQLPQLHSQ